MYKNESKITNDGFGVHTFELTIPSITKDEFERIVNCADKAFFCTDGNSIFIYPERRGIRFFLNHTENNFYNIKVIVSPRRLIDENSQPMDILRASDDFDMLESLINQSIAECLGNNYCIESFKLSRLDFCVNIMLFESFSAERYVKLLILIFNHIIDKIQSLPVMLLMVSLDREQIVSHSLSTTFCSV